MIVQADLTNGYRFKIDSGELKYINSGFKSSLVPCGDGLVYTSQSSISSTLIISQPFCSIYGSPFLAKKTYAPKSKMIALYDHELTINAEFNAICTIAEAGLIKPYHWVKSDGSEFHCNHIPQLWQKLNGLFIIGVSGDFDWKRRIFSGALYCGGGVMNEGF